jgi:FHA domain-containing protein
MKITIRAVSLNELPITQPIATVFTAQGGSIGRADTNQLALPDPERRISRRQAEIAFEGKCFVIRNVGSANPIIVRDRSLALGESAPLSDHDQVRIGGYLLEVTSALDGAEDNTTVDVARTALPDPFVANAPFAGLEAKVSPDNPFAELLGEAPNAPAGPFGRPAPSRLPDDFDPFAPPSPPPVAARPPTQASGGGAFDDLVPTAERGSIDALFGLSPSSGSSDPLAAFMAGAAPVTDASAKGTAASTDPLAMFANAREPIAACRPSVPDHTPELRAGYAPPKPVPPPAPRVAPASPSPAPSPPVAAAKAEPRPASPLAARAAAAQSVAQAAAAAPRPTKPRPATTSRPIHPQPPAGPKNPSPSGTTSAKAQAFASTRRPTPALRSCASSA